MNTYTHKGKPAWSGVVSLIDGWIEETFSYGQCARADFHHSLVCSEAAIERIFTGESAYFWVEPDGLIVGTTGLGGNARDVPEEFLDLINSQITLTRQEALAA